MFAQVVLNGALNLKWQTGLHGRVVFMFVQFITGATNWQMLLLAKVEN